VPGIKAYSVRYRGSNLKVLLSTIKDDTSYDGEVVGAAAGGGGVMDLDVVDLSATGIDAVQGKNGSGGGVAGRPGPVRVE